MHANPKIIEEKSVTNGRHLLVRLDAIEQVTTLCSFFRHSPLGEQCAAQLQQALSGLFAFDKTTFFSGRYISPEGSLDYLVADDGKSAHSAFIFFLFQGEDEVLHTIGDLTDERYFEL